MRDIYDSMGSVVFICYTVKRLKDERAKSKYSLLCRYVNAGDRVHGYETTTMTGDGKVP